MVGLPVQVRDQMLRVNSSDYPKSDVNREYYIQQIEREVRIPFQSSPVHSIGHINMK